MKKKIYTSFLLILLATVLSAQQRRDHAVFFPVTDYPKGSGWATLDKTLPECQAIARELKQVYGFDEPEIWANKTKQQIKDKLVALRQTPYGPDDQLLLFFSMHGYFDDAGDAGCLVPAGGKGDDPAYDTWLLHTELRALVSAIPCKHILLVIDACYSGTFGGSKAQPNPVPGVDCAEIIQKALGLKSRNYIASGGKEKVPADSDLARRWRTALNNRGGDDGILTLNELMLYLNDASPTPKWGAFSGDQGGSFIFVVKNGCGGAPPPVDPESNACRHARSQQTVEAWDFYLQVFPTGACAAEAKEERTWLLAKRQDTPEAYAMYLAIYPNGRHAGEAPERPKTDALLLIKGGTFQMGSDAGETDEKPVHPVTVSDFYLAKYEVTVAEFRAFVEDSSYQTDAEKEGDAWGYEGTEWKKIPGRNWRHDPEGKSASDNHPVINVSWNDAVAYCEWLSKKTGLSYRLPTEAEWEYAAGNGRKHTRYSWGNDDPAGKNGGNVADETAKKKFTGWTIFSGYTDGYTFTAPVGSYKANDFGLFDMSGNVWEWCSDWYGDYTSGAQTNPTGPTSGSYRVIRGGSWRNTPQYCRVADRGGDSPGNRDSYIGFRLARTF